MDLNEMRQEINDIDRQLLQLFLQRMNVSTRIAQYKIQRQLPVFQPQREDEIIQWARNTAGGEMADYAEQFYRSLMAISREKQHADLRTQGHSQENL